MAGGAKIADENILDAKARGQELRTVGFAEIEMDVFRGRLVAGGLHVEPLERVGLFAGAGFVEIIRGIGELRGEFDDKISGDFVAAGTDGRANGGEKIRGLAAEFELHAADGFLRDAGEGASPSGVDGRDGALFSINEEDGDAVGGLDGEEDTGTIRGGGVAFARIGGGLREVVKDVGMDLL